jgi:hypothetical protein
MQDDQRDVRIGLELSGLEQNEGRAAPGRSDAARQFKRL